jgi:voltage-gated sodium channel type II alpha
MKVYFFSPDLEEDGEEEEGQLGEAIMLDAGTEDVMLSDYPADCCPDKCYKRFPFFAGDDDSPYWQGWANLRQKTYQLIENKYFETAVITMILLSSLALVSSHIGTAIHLLMSAVKL